MLPAQLVEEVEAVRADDYSIELIEQDGWANVLLQDYPLPSGFNKKSTTLLLMFPLSYPNGQPDMFWTDPDLTLADGRVPNQAEVMQTALGKEWRRFSWHPQRWNPGVDNLKTYLEFVNNRLVKQT